MMSCELVVLMLLLEHFWHLAQAWWHSHRSQMPQKTVYWNQPTAGTLHKVMQGRKQTPIVQLHKSFAFSHAFVTAAKPLGTSANLMSEEGERYPHSLAKLF